MSVNYRFTLLEMVLALAVFSVIASLTGSLLFTSQKSWGTIREQSERLEQLMRLDRIADTVFRNAVPFHWPGEDNRNYQIFRGNPDRLRLAALCRANSENESAIRFIELYQEGTQLIARYRKYPILDGDAEGCTMEVIAEEVRKVSFFYAIRTRSGIRWQSELNDGEEFPAAIRMELEFDHGGSVRYLRRTAGNSECSVYGKFTEPRQ